MDKHLMSLETEPKALADLPSGELHGAVHHFKIRVYYEDTDLSGVVYHSNYLKFFERCRTEFLRAVGIHHKELLQLEIPLAFAVADIQISFKTPARIDDVLSITTRFIKSSGASFHLHQAAHVEGRLIAEQKVHAVCIDLEGRPRRLPAPYRDVIKRLGSEEK